MKIISGITNVIEKYRNPVVTVGVFDGVHIGHQQLIHYVKKTAQSIKGTSVVVTFFPHPVHVLKPERYLPLIVSLPYRLKLLEDLGVDVCVICRFQKKFALLPPKDFLVKYIVRKMRPKAIIVGDDFRFGCFREGTVKFMQDIGKKYGFQVFSFNTKQKGQARKIGSSNIRQHILKGRFKQAEKLLNRPVSILGKVVHGEGRGKALGYPTANINPSQEIVPPRGVYLVNVIYNNKLYKGMANIGVHPTFSNNGDVNVEINIFNFNKCIYDKEIIVEFVKKIRNEKCFKSEQDLIRQIKLDELIAREWASKQG